MKARNYSDKQAKSKAKFNSKLQRVSKKEGVSWKGKNYNDVSWYGKNQQLVVDTASIPFNQPMNAPLQTNRSIYGEGMPMLMTLAHDWLIGDVSTMTVAARQIWADVRKVNSGATNYEGSDIISIITAAADVFINIKWLSSFFGIVGYFNARNKLMPQLIFRSAGIDYDDFVANLADYRARFNTLLLRARTITIPKKYPWIDAAMALYGNLFKDEDTDTGREQLYFVNKAAFYKLAVTGENGYTVTPVALSDMGGFDGPYTYPYAVFTGALPTDNRGWTSANEAYITGTADSVLNSVIPFKRFLDVLELQITSIVTDEDANIIQGDLLKAFGDESAYTTGQVTADYEIRPTYSEEFGWYLHNATIYGSPVLPAGDKFISTSSGTSATFRYNCISYKETATTFPVGYYKRITQLPGRNAFSSNLTYTQMNSALTHPSFANFKPCIDTDKYNPTPEDVIWNSRAINLFLDNEESMPVISNGILLNAMIWYVNIKASGVLVGAGSVTAEKFTNIWTSQTTPTANQLMRITAFKWYPLIYIAQATGSNYFIGVYGNVSNIVPIERSVLNRINEIVLLSLFDIPQR